jgi:glyoxylase-like metal-dependent hydrolase (beta-lactamase superfamily II)
MVRRWAPLLIAIGMFGACSHRIPPPVTQGQSAFALTGGPNASMIYIARTAEGLVAIDLGWWGNERALNQALRELGASRTDITEVFLTHAHRDHVGAWRSLSDARFHIADAEHSRLVGDTPHRGWIPKLADRIKRPVLPRAGELDVRTFSQDTSFVVGGDTLRAYLVPGHTPGSTVYLFRGVLFLGDAATYSALRGFGSAKRGYSDDARVAAENLGRLWPRLRFSDVRYVCTAHASCAPFSGRFVLDVVR